MTDKLMLDGREVKVGDRLYDLVFGWGEVKGITVSLVIRFVHHAQAYDAWTGIPNLVGFPRNRTLYWDEPTITPKPIRRKVTKWRWVVKGVCGGLFVSDDFYSTAKDVEKAIPASAIQKIDSTAKEFDEEDA